MEGLACVLQLPPPHHAGKVRDEPQHAALEAAQKFKGAARSRVSTLLGVMQKSALLGGSGEARRGEHEELEGCVFVDQELKRRDQARPVASMNGSLEDGWVNVAIVVVGGALEYEPRGNVDVAARHCQRGLAADARGADVLSCTHFEEPFCHVEVTVPASGIHRSPANGHGTDVLISAHFEEPLCYAEVAMPHPNFAVCILINGNISSRPENRTKIPAKTGLFRHKKMLTETFPKSEANSDGTFQ